MNFRYFFGFTKGQYKGLILLLTLNLGVILFYFVDDYLYQAKPPHDFSSLIAHLDSIDDAKTNLPIDSLFQFDPNKLAVHGFLDLGLKHDLAMRIGKYRSNGGKFLSSEDLLKIYGMDSLWYNKVESFVEIEAKKKPEKKPKTLKPFAFNPNKVSEEELLRMNLNETLASSWIKYLDNGGSFKNCAELEKLYLLGTEDLKTLLPYCELSKSNESVVKVDINLADSLSLLELKGIGPAFSHRIVEYRKLLGGYTDMYQLKEIYGVDSLKYFQLQSQVTIQRIEVAQVFINSDEFKSLLAHPYLSYEQVKSIVNYRKELGPLNNLAELLQLEGFDEDDTLRLKPYLSFKIN